MTIAFLGVLLSSPCRYVIGLSLYDLTQALDFQSLALK